MALNHAPFVLAGRKALLLADGEFSTFGSKTAVCYLRHRPDDVVAVLDRTQAGKTVGDILGGDSTVPIVADVTAARSLGAELAIIGVAPAGGQLTSALSEQVLEAITAGMDVVSGLHTLLHDNDEIAGAADRRGVHLWDVRHVPPSPIVGSGAGCQTGARIVLTIGSDCNVGKMTTTVALYDEAIDRGLSAAWAATGQTGMMLRGRGLAIDRVVADFLGGAAEELVNFEGENVDWVFVEGQGSILHPGFAGVTLGLLYGVMPDAMILVHAATRETIGETSVSVPPLSDLASLHERFLAPYRKSRVVAIAVNTAGIEKSQACDTISEIREETKLPVCDPVRDGAGILIDAIIADAQTAKS